MRKLKERSLFHCLKCNIAFYKRPCEVKRGETKFCSRQCYDQHGSRINKGERHHNWKGDKVGYKELHAWVARWLGKPSKCEFCKKDGFKGKSIDWANKSGKYLRDLSDWIRLCKPCHKMYDLYGT